MDIYERIINIPVIPSHKNLISYFRKTIQSELKPNEVPIRFIVHGINESHYECEVDIMILDTKNRMIPSIFEFKQRSFENMEKFNAVLMIPTGIGAEIGGHAGDAGPVCKLLASVCDNLITHPNVVNASDINEIPDNTLYVEGSILSRLLMGDIGLQKVRSNRILFVKDHHDDNEFNWLAVNSLNAAVACYGLECSKIITLSPSINLTAHYTNSGRAAGFIKNFNRITQVLDQYKDDYDAIAISSVIQFPRHVGYQYFATEGEMVNPWGGIEAMFTHALSLMYNIPTAHSPMMDCKEGLNTIMDIVDPRMAAETVSYTFLQCILKGLQRSPRIIQLDDVTSQQGITTVKDISCLVIPDHCIGLPVLAALEQNIPVIAVRGNRNLSKNDLTLLPWKTNQLYFAENYLEAAGIMNAIKSGVAIRSLLRPIMSTPIEVIHYSKES